MGWGTQGHRSATMQRGITLERSRADLNAFLIICFAWRAPRAMPALPAAKPGVLSRGA